MHALFISEDVHFHSSTYLKMHETLMIARCAKGDATIWLLGSILLVFFLIRAGTPYKTSNG